ncbi:MAG: hypothetical protein AAB834_05610 [Patescibacteria group bacterium]
MLKQSSTLPAKKKVGPNKLVMAFAALAATAVIGGTGVAAAAQDQSGSGYGNTNTHVSVGVNVHGDNNVVHVILSFFRN